MQRNRPIKLLVISSISDLIIRREAAKNSQLGFAAINLRTPVTSHRTYSRSQDVWSNNLAVRATALQVVDNDV
jgi:hypothetical protein